MKFLWAIMLLFISINMCLAQSAKTSDISIDNKWQSSWKLFKSKTQINGVVIEHNLTNILCGKLKIASNSIVVTADGDTIRVLEMCNTNKMFSKSDRVKVLTISGEESDLDFTPLNSRYVNVKKTCYGTILKLD